MQREKTTKEIGDRGERIAARYLRRSGYRILARNYRCAHGEIDIIAQNREYLVFVEVKTRKDDQEHFENYGLPCEAVNKTKQQHIVYTAKSYLGTHANDRLIRFDIIEVYLGKKARVRLIEDAFRP